MSIKGFNEWLNETLSASIEKDVKLLILHCLSELQPNGGNNDIGMTNRNWSTINPIFGEEGPDTWVNTDFGGKIDDVIDHLRNYDDVERVSSKSITVRVLNWLNPKAKEYGLNFQSLYKDETVFELLAKSQDEVVNFYKKRPKMIEELERELKNTIKSRKLGI